MDDVQTVARNSAGLATQCRTIGPGAVKVHRIGGRELQSGRYTESARQCHLIGDADVSRRTKLIIVINLASRAQRSADTLWGASIAKITVL
jgi:hypothetical protein